MGADMHAMPWGTFAGEAIAQMELPCGCKFAFYNTGHKNTTISQWCGLHGVAEDAVRLLEGYFSSGYLPSSDVARVVREARTKKEYAPFPSVMR